MKHRLAVIGGSQAYTLLQAGEFAGEKIGVIRTPFGDSQPVFRIERPTSNLQPPTSNQGMADEVQGPRFKVQGAGLPADHPASDGFLFLSRHGVGGYHIAAPWVNYRANIWALKELGATHIVSWSGPGTLDESLMIGQFVLPNDLIDETKRRNYSFFEGRGRGFVRQNPVFCPTLTQAIVEVMDDMGVKYRAGGVYVCTEGPRLETPAEIRKFRMFGADLVGMTLVPEIFLAKELEMHYGSICYITNYAEGLRERPFEPGVLFEGLLDEDEKKAVGRSVEMFPKIMASLASNLEVVSSSCYCDKLMERYRRRGDIGEDWHTWISSR